MLNRVVLMGRLVADPELKQTQNGVSVTSFRIAVDRNYVRQGEDRKADFFDIVAWRKTAEFIANNFGKGSLIAVEGQLQTRQYQAQDGTNRNVVEVVVDNASFTGERRNADATPAATKSAARKPALDINPLDDEDDLPFTMDKSDDSTEKSEPW